MAFTREFIRNAAKESGVEIPKELEDALIQEHLSARDAFAGEQVKTELEKNKPEPAPAVKDTPEYKKLKKDFESYKADIAARDAYAAKEKAYRAILKQANISGKRIDTVVKAAKADGVIDGIELDENGDAKNAGKLEESVRADWSDFIVTTKTRGAEVAHPPYNGGGTLSRDDILNIRDTGERQAAIAANPELFGI